jgi:excisionase family DNA binding protein
VNATATPKQSTASSLVYTYTETAALLKCKKSAVRSLVRSGVLKHVVIGHAHVIPHWCLEEFLHKQATDDTRSDERPSRFRKAA